VASLPPINFVSGYFLLFIISDMTGSYKKQFLLKKYFIGSMECATMGKCKNQEMRKTNEIK